MKFAPRDVVITGLGAVSSLGDSAGALWASVGAGRDGIREIRRFKVDSFRSPSGAVVAGFDDGEGAAKLDTEGLCLRFALDAAREAISDAGFDPSGRLPEPTALVFGTGLGGLERPIHLLVRDLAVALGCRGPAVTVSTACSSSTGAIGLGRDLLAMGAARAVLAGGADVLSPEVFAGFHSLGVLSREKCAPFSKPFGTTLGEGAGFVVLERAASARERGARCRVHLSGFGLSGDAYHETSPDPSGSGIERALRSALRDAAVETGQIGYVNAHGSGTEANDPAEWRGIRRGLGVRAEGLPVSSTKGALGHAQGAAGVLETIVTILAMEQDVVPPTLHFEGPRPHAPTNPVGQPFPRPWSYDHALCLNSAFGGANAALVLSRSGRSDPHPSRRRIHIVGVGLIGPGGLGDRAFAPPGTGGENGGRVPPFSIERLIPTADPRGLDPMSRYLAAAVVLALRDAGLTLRGERRDRIGLIVGALHPSPESLRAFRRSIDERGLLGLSASAFARIVLNAPAGFCSEMLSIRGPLSTISTGPGSGLAAVAFGAELLSTRDDLDWIAVAAVDESGRTAGAGAIRPEADGAVCLVLGADRSPATLPARDTDVRLEGWGLADPHRRDDSIGIACDAHRGVPAGAGKFFSEDDDETFPYGPQSAIASAAACAAAVASLRRGDRTHAVVTTSTGGTSSVALLLASGGHAHVQEH